MRYRDRIAAGRRLAGDLAHHRDAQLIVLGVPRGGVVVAAEVADAFACALDVVVVRKIGAPLAPELAVGAVGADGIPLIDAGMVERLGIGEGELALAAQRAAAEVRRRLRHYRGSDTPLDVRGRAVIVVDDGVATGATLRAGLREIRALSPERLVCAVPVGPPMTVDLLLEDCDEVVCPVQPDRFRAVGEWYDDFTQVEDDEVMAILDRRT
ncbi:phosphoribosyltransferase [bacterium]|nr:phosphoribosyltransferase [bacterium]